MSNSFFVCYAREDYEYVASFKLELDNLLRLKSENFKSKTNIDLKIDQSIKNIKDLYSAESTDISFFHSKKYKDF